MSEPRRPEPDQSWSRRLIDRFVMVRSRLFDRPTSDPLPDDPDMDRERPLLLIAITAVGSAALALGLLWGWQAWSDRSAEPIDSRLPMLVADAEATTERAEEAPPPAQAAARIVASPSGPATTPAPPELDADEAVAGVGTEPAADSTVIVHVAGEVRWPGIVTLDTGARVNDAVLAAGGALAEADLDRVNLAAPVVDGERIHVPAVGEDPPPVVATIRPDQSGSPAAPRATPTPTVVDLNRAGLAELEGLPGIGPATAQSIIDTRDARGPFYSVDELLEVDGIGPAKLEELRPFVWVQSS